MDATQNSYPDWIQVNFNGNKTINEIDVFTLQDNYEEALEPTETMTFSLHGIVSFQAQYWNGSSWQTVSGGSVSGNDKVWRKFTFSAITTDKMRVNVTSALNGHSRVTEVEAWGPSPAVNYSYDAEGNVSNDGAHSYGYDSENRIVSVDGGSTATYGYDNQNRRYKKTVGSTVTHYVWEGAQVITEHNGADGAVIYNYVYSGSRLLARMGSGVINWYLSDRLSTRLVLDASGNVIGRQGHLPFGDDFGEIGTQEKHHFTSYERDGESGIDYAVNRHYAPVVGRFARTDPAGGSYRLEAPQSLNRYSYVRNDPVDLTDPAGLDPWWGWFHDPVRGWTLCILFPESCDDGSARDPGGRSGASGTEGQGKKPILLPSPKRKLCEEQDLTFTQSSGRYNSAELSALALTAIGEAGFLAFDRREVEAVIATAVNRQSYNVAFESDHSRPHFGEGPLDAPTDIIEILSQGYDAYNNAIGETRITQQKAINFARDGTNGLLEGDIICDQLVAAKAFARRVGNLSASDVFAMYPVTFNHAGINFRPPRNSRNVVVYGSTTFWNGNFGPPQV